MAREFSVIVGIDAGRARRGAREFRAGANSVVRDSKRMSRGMQSANRRAVAMITTLGRLRGVATLAFSGFLGVGGITSVIRTISQFETAISSVTALVSAQNPRSLASTMTTLSERAREMGATTLFTATQAAEGMKFLSLAGFEAVEVYQAIEPALNLAAAGMLGLGEAADIVSNIMAAFNVDASETETVADALAFTAARTNTNIRQLGEAMKFVGPVAGTLGIDVQETSIALGILGNSGLQASLAGTSLRRVMSGLLNPSKEARKVLAGMNLTSEELVNVLQGGGETGKGLVDLVNLLAERGIGAAEAFTLFGQRGAPGLLSLVTQKDDLEELTEGLDDIAGTAERMAKILADNLGGDARIALSGLQEAILRLSDAGLGQWLRDVTQTFTGFIRTLAGIETPFDELNENLMRGERLARVFLDNLKLLKAMVVALTVYLFRNFIRAIALTAMNLGAAALKASVLGRGLIATRTGAMAAAAGLKTFRAALASTGVGIALIAGSYLVDYLMSMNDAEEATDTFVDSLDGIKEEGERVAEAFHGMAAATQAYRLELQQTSLAEMKREADELSEALLAHDQALLTVEEDTRRYEEALKAASEVDTGNTGFSNMAENIETTARLNEARLELNETNKALELDRVKALSDLAELNGAIIEQEQLVSDLVLVMNGEAESVEALRKAREKANETRDLEAKKYKDAFGLMKDEVDAAKDLIDKYDDRGKTITELEEDLESLLKVQAANLEALKLEGVEAERLKVAIENLRKKIREWQTELTPAQERMQKLNDQLEDMNPNLTKAGAANLEFTRAVREAAFAMAAGKISAEEYQAEVEKLRQIYELTVENMCDANEKVRECTEDSTERMNKAWESAITNIQSAIADFIKGGLDDFGSFADNIVDVFKDMIAEMLSAWVTSGLMNIFQGKAFGSGGNSFPFADVLKNVFGSGGAGGGGAGGAGGTGGFGGISGLGTAMKDALGAIGSMATAFGHGVVSFFSGAGGASAVASGAATPQAVSIFNTGAQNAAIANPGSFTAGGVVAGAATGVASGFVVDQIVGSRGDPGTTLSLSAIGGAIGSIWGPIGSLIGGAIGSFASNLLGGAKKLESAILEFEGSMDGVNATVESVVSKQRSFFRGRKFTTTRTDIDTSTINEVIDSIVNAITQTAELLGVSADALSNFTIDREIDIKGKTEEQIQTLLNNLFDELILGMIGEFVDNTEGLSERLQKSLKTFQGNAEEFLTAFQLLATIDVTLAVDPIKQVQDAIQQEAVSLTESYQGVLAAYRELVANYDGSLESLEALTAATLIMKEVQVQLAAALISAGEAISATFRDSAQSIREQMMTEEQLYNLRRDQIDDLVEQAMNTTDPAELARLAEQINTLGLDAWNLLDEDQKAALGQEFVDFFDNMDEIFGGQINAGLDQISEDSSAIDQEVADSMTSAAQAIIDANNAARDFWLEQREWWLENRYRYNGGNEMRP